MPEVANPTFLVNADSDPVVIRIEGRASFQNSSSLKEFFADMIGKGKIRFVIDFINCTTMDSTFLGVLAGAALELRKLQPAGSMVFSRVGPRNQELVRNLGLHRLVLLDLGDADTAVKLAQPVKALAPGEKLDELANARHVLAAHENLITADAQNLVKFQDVLNYLKDRIQQG
ncbi:anti-sigma factor antagonist [Verrucomicrobia bacterium IMCC26134]|jgi:anti-anti-sigma regulatory factor|nr:anti-sigma factor antagonist [Verrucomicrobia bacterium IMCC26134]